MRLITSKGQLDLPSDFSLTIEQNNPVFSTEGTQSIPTSLPVSKRNLEALGYPTRLGRADRLLRKFPAKIEAGAIHKDGQLVIDSIQKGSGIVGAVMLNESDLYTQIKDATMKEAFAGVFRIDFSEDPNPVQSWYNHIYDCMKGTKTDDFTAFPLAVNYTEENGYQILNCPDITSQLDPWGLKWQARSIPSGSETVTVPAGYGITPFLWLYRVIEILFSRYGYTVLSNPFREDSLLKKIVLINNTADAICAGTLNYQDLLPTCTVAEFIKWIEVKFLTHIYIDSEKKTVEIIPLQSILSSVPDLDISNKVNGEIKHILIDAMEVDMSSDTSLDGATPAAETLGELTVKYETMTEVDEAAWRNYDWGATPAFKNSLIFRKALGQYYDIYFRRTGGPTTFTSLGSNYFRRYTGAAQAKEYKAIDTMPAMVEVNIGTVQEIDIDIICPYAGPVNHLTTTYKDEKNDISEQKIIIAYNAGPAANDSFIQHRYIIGTTQRYNNLGIQWCDLDLTTEGLYQRFFDKWDDALQKQDCEIECRVDYSAEDLMSMKMSGLKMLSGQLLLQKGLSYRISNKIENEKASFLVLRR